MLSPGPGLVHGLRGGLRHQRGGTCHHQLQAVASADENRWVRAAAFVGQVSACWESAYFVIWCGFKVPCRVTYCNVQMWQDLFGDFVAALGRFVSQSDGMWAVMINFNKPFLSQGKNQGCADILWFNNPCYPAEVSVKKYPNCQF